MRRHREHFVYIVTCSDGTLYTGYTTEPARRLREHNAGIASKYTRARLPVKLTYLERVGSAGLALRREREIKQFSRTQKLSLCRAHPPSPDPAHARVVNQRAPG